MRTPDESAVPVRQLREAVARGVITQAQLDTILTPADGPPPREAPRGFNAVTLAYWVGSIAVLFAFGWFLVDRWEALGPAGVLGVVALYATLFAGTGVYLRREGYDLAGGTAAVLAVGMAPLGAWALLSLAGLWPRGPSWPLCEWYSPIYLECNGKWIVVELATILAALVALRWVKFAGLAEPIAVALFFLALHLAESLAGRPFRDTALGWSLAGAASLILTLAYAVDRRQARGGEDYAFWLYLSGAVAAAVAMAMLWGEERALRHLLPAVAFLALAASLFLRRRAFLALGGASIIFYFGYLAFDVFRRTLAFPFLLATFGIAVILVAVLLQRSYPRLAGRVAAARTDDRPYFPGGYASFLAPLVAAFIAMPFAIERDRERAAEQRWRERMWQRREVRARRQAPQKPVAKPVPPRQP